MISQYSINKIRINKLYKIIQIINRNKNLSDSPI